MNKLTKYCIGLVLLNICIFHQIATAQQPNAAPPKPMVFSGSLGFTNNGFSIIPSFSFNDPASIVLLSWKKQHFSVDPEFRIIPSGKKGSILLWFRYHAIEGKRFSLRIGAHPAVNWFPNTIVQNGISEELIRLRRFLAWELAPVYKISKNWNVSLYYLQGNGLQDNGPKTTHFVNLNTTISNIGITQSIKLTVTPAVYYLYLDKNDGIFFTASASLSSSKHPFSLQSTINQKLQSTIPDTKAFMWNVGVAYAFRKVLSSR